MSSIAEFKKYDEETEVNLLDKVKIILSILRIKKWKPKIRFSNGVTMDLNNREIILEQPTKIHCNEQFELSSSKHFIINSSQEQEDDRMGYIYGVWFNPEMDHKNRPIMYIQCFHNETDESLLVPVKDESFDDNGNFLLPEGYNFKSAKMIQYENGYGCNNMEN